MSLASNHKWTFAARFRRNAFGWRSQPAVARVREAVAEIKKVARKAPLPAAEGAVLFLEKVSPALEQVDSSSGAIGSAVNRAIEELVSIIVQAPAEERLRDKWLDRLWKAVEADEIPYIELLPDFWGELCLTRERAGRWADELIGITRLALSPDPQLRGYFKGTTACLSALYQAGRYEEILELLEPDPHPFWPYRRWGVKALEAMGRKAEALDYAEKSRGLNDNPTAIARACEEILLSCGLIEEAYRRYALPANQKMTHLATFRAVAKKYPHKTEKEILLDLVAGTPGQEGKWFAVAKEAGLYQEAIALANQSPCDPKTLTRAARDAAVSNPSFAVEAGMAALRWLVEGYGYEITGLDVLGAYQQTLKAAEQAGCRAETWERIRRLVAEERFGERFVTKILGKELGITWRSA